MKNLQPDQVSNFYKIKLTRDNREGLIFLTCDMIPEFFVTLFDEKDVRPAVDEMLKKAFSNVPCSIQVYTNGRIDGPTIDTIVCSDGRL